MVVHRGVKLKYSCRYFADSFGEYRGKWYFEPGGASAHFIGETTDGLMREFFRYELDVPPEAVDENGHVNNVMYVQWMQDAAVKHYFAEGGEKINEREGATWVVRKHSVEYKRPAFDGERIAVFTWLTNRTSLTTQRNYAFVRISDGMLLVRGQTEWVFVDVQRGRPRPIPEDMLEKFLVMPDDWLPPLTS